MRSLQTEGPGGLWDKPAVAAQPSGGSSRQQAPPPPPKRPELGSTLKKLSREEQASRANAAYAFCNEATAPPQAAGTGDDPSGYSDDDFEAETPQARGTRTTLTSHSALSATPEAKLSTMVKAAATEYDANKFW